MPMMLKQTSHIDAFVVEHSKQKVSLDPGAYPDSSLIGASPPLITLQGLKAMVKQHYTFYTVTTYIVSNITRR
jgi:hypothetical protein